MPEENLTTMEEGIRHVQRHSAGDRSATRVPTNETVGDPDEGSPEAAGQTGAAARARRCCHRRSFGMVAGAAVGAAAGTAAEGDEDRPATRDDQRKERQYEEWRHDDE